MTCHGTSYMSCYLHILKSSYMTILFCRYNYNVYIYSFVLKLFNLVEKELGEHLNGRNLTEAENAFILTLNPGHILAFATGSSKVPAIGCSPSPKLTFVHDDTKHLLIAHTCSNELQIFVNRKNLADDDEFDYNCLVALMNGSIFSAV